MKKILLATLITISTIYANEIPVLKAGQTISGDQLNETHTVLQKSTPEIQASILLGSYVCTNYQQSVYDGGYTKSPDGYYYYKEFDVVFNDDGDGTFSWTRDRGLVQPSQVGSINTEPYEVVMNIFHSKPTSTSGLEYFTLLQDGENYRFYRLHGSGTMVDFQCINKKLLSSVATDLTSTITDDSVTLTWTDNSADETGFNILRKDSLTGTYSVIGTVSQDLTTYSDDTLANGTYWYRVQATNDNGDSLGSNVARVIVGNQ